MLKVAWTKGGSTTWLSQDGPQVVMTILHLSALGMP
jgi:hypothetical protein